MTVGAARPIPIADCVEHGAAVVRRRRDALELRNHQRRSTYGRVELDRPEVSRGQSIALVPLQCPQDCRGAVAGIPLVAKEVAVAAARWRVIGADDDAARRIEGPGQIREGDSAGPFVPSVVAADRPVAGRATVADRDPTRQLVADVTVDVGVDEVLGRRAKAAQRRPEVVKRARGVEPEDRLEGAVGDGGCRPPKRHQRGLRQARIDAVEDGPVAGLADRQRFGLAAGDLDLLVAHGERDRLATEQVVRRIAGICLLEE